MPVCFHLIWLLFYTIVVLALRWYERQGNCYAVDLTVLERFCFLIQGVKRELPENFYKDPSSVFLRLIYRPSNFADERNNEVWRSRRRAATS